jgi:flagellar protein FlaG
MIDGVAINSDNLMVNTGGGSVPSPPPSSSESSGANKRGSTGQVDSAAKLDGQLKPEGANEAATVEQAAKAEGSADDLDNELRDTIERLNDKLARLDREILLKVDERIGKNYVSVIDKGSQEVIREFPPKEIRSFIARFMEFNEKLASDTDIRSLIVNLEV